MAAKTPLSYQERTYRSSHNAGLAAFEVKMAETDLHILASSPAENQALLAVTKVRAEIESYIRQYPHFLASLVPLPLDNAAPESVQAMLAAALKAGVGPMAAVAGTIAEYVGRTLLAQGVDEVIVDIFLARKQASTVAIYAGESRLSGKLGICLRPEQMPCGLCCSSGTIGHSFSFGVADAAAVLAPTAALADAAATCVGNAVKSRDKKSVSQAVVEAQRIEGLSGVVVIAGEHLGAWGNVELVRL